MPSVHVSRDDLFAKIGRTFTNEEFADLCFDLGVECDDIITEADLKGANAKNPEAIWFKIDVPANRYDILCIEGLARAFKIFLKQMEAPTYEVIRPENPLKMVQDASTFAIRPFVVCAVLRNVEMNEKIYNSFIDLQDKLHFNIGRRRQLVAIGTHDLDLIQGPFTYTAERFDQIKFVALNETKETNVDELFDTYRNRDQCHLKPYLDIAAAAQPGVPADQLLHPVIRDARGQVLSLPPVINSEYSKISLNTRNIFIECTATDYTKANIVLNMIVAMFSEYCAKPFSVELVQVESPANLPLPPASPSAPIPKSESEDASKLVLSYPTMACLTFETSVKYLTKGIGKEVSLTSTQICELLSKLQLKATAEVPDSTDCKVTVVAPPTRCDILHPIDIQEDVAVAYGYNNIQQTIPAVNTVGAENPLNKLADQIRQVIAMCGYTEVMTWALIRTEENYELLGRTDPGNHCVTLANSKTDFTACRTTLIPGLLKVLAANKADPLPVRIFECGDVVFQDSTRAERARNFRRLAALHAGTSSGISQLHGLVDKFMEQLGVNFVLLTDFEKAVSKAREAGDTKSKFYTIAHSESKSNTFLPGRSIDIIVSGLSPAAETELQTNRAAVLRNSKAPSGLIVGSFGILNPTVVENFELAQHAVCSVVELDIELFL